MATMSFAPTTITIDYRKHAIEVSKSFSKKATIFGSTEYNQLKEAKADFPTFRVVIKSAPKRKFEDKITMKDILYYVEKHSGKNTPEMKQIEELRGKSVKDAENVFDFEESASFKDIKEWFFATYPDLAEKTEKRQARIAEILANAKETDEKVAEAAKNAASA